MIIGKYFIEDIQRVTYNGNDTKLFKVSELRDNAYHFVGQFRAPGKTPNSKLVDFIHINDQGE